MNQHLGNLLMETDWPVELNTEQRQALLQQKIHRAQVYQGWYRATVKQLTTTRLTHANTHPRSQRS